jgi:hypothetical protein
MSVFVEKEFYHEPPSPEAPAQEWETWMTREKRSRAAHKAQHTKSLEHDQEAYDSMFADEGLTVKVNGVYRQQGAFIGFAGSAEEGTLTMERGVAEDQERKLAVVNMEAHRHTRGSRSRNRNARRRANRKARKHNQ